ncbi:MAG: hypothetical protein NC084_11930 [Bacteroides sp.]|nr:hypothetical protein [Eubacterium sp.]MCM1419037.1 hypothetical protein [Roseburia sp.]MCM1463401.1 hypothetical protein [Bacteroides sp.]
MNENEYDEETGLPLDPSYLERGLPKWLEKSVEQMKIAWAKEDAGEKYFRWDCDWCDLQSAINAAEVEQLISPRQADHLREKYLRLKRDDDL